MTLEQHIHALEKDLISIREDMVGGTLTEERVWEVLQHVSTLADQAQGGPLEERTQFIYGMLEVVWSNVHQVDKVRRLMDPGPDTMIG